MRIVMCLMNEFTHDLRVLKEGKSLTASGHDVHIVALKKPETPAEEVIDGIHVHRVHLKTRDKLPKNYLFWFIKYLEFVRRSVITVKSLKPDAVHCHDLNTLAIGMRVRKDLACPVVYDSHELYLDRNFPLPVHLLWKTIERFGIRRADKVFVENPSRGEVLEKRYRITGTIPLRNCQPLNLIERSDVLQKKFGLSQEDRIVIYQGIVTKARGMDQTIEMMSYLPNYVHLVIVGDGAYLPVIREKISENSPGIHLTGRVSLDELQAYTASAHIGISLIQNVNNNHYYALSNKIFEYMSAGLPVVFSDFPEMRRVITEENAGLVVDEKNPEMAAQAVMNILDSPERYDMMSRNARRAVRQKYNWDNEVRVLIDYYNSIS